MEDDKEIKMGEWPDWTEEDYQKAEEEDRKALAEYFAAHADQTPFMLGDKVLVTNEAQHRLRMFHVKDIGKTATISGYDFNRHSSVWLESIEASWVCPFTIHLVLRMRQAYLDQQAGTVEA